MINHIPLSSFLGFIGSLNRLSRFILFTWNYDGNLFYFILLLTSHGFVGTDSYRTPADP